MTERLRRGRWFAVVLAAWVGGSLLATAAVTAHSRSGQFVVHSVHATPPTLGQLRNPAATNLVRLEPDPLAVSCERVKEGVLRFLGLPDRWRGKVHLWLRPSAMIMGPPQVLATHFADTYQYDLDLPDEIEPAQLVRLLAEVLLAELAQRNPGPYSPELPIWLVEGLTGQLLTTAGPDLVLEPNALVSRSGTAWGQLQPTTRSVRASDALRANRARLRAQPALTFKDLSLPAPELLTGGRLEGYRAAAQVFLAELVRLPRGQRALTDMLGQLTQTLNWQTAFLRAFAPIFGRWLDVEKWWALLLAQITASEEGRVWPRAATLDRLDTILRVTVEVRPRARELPQRRSLPLQQVIAEWDFGRQSRVLRPKLNQLEAALVRGAPELAPLLADYAAVLRGYLAQRGRAFYAGNLRAQAAADLRFLVHDTNRALDALDRRRAGTRE